MARRILVVDDDPSVLRMLTRSLSAEGHEVEAAPDGGAALAAVERRAPEAVVLDVAMPDMDGLARDTIADRVAGLEAGADDYLVKPFAVEELLARLAAIERRGRPRSSTVIAGSLALDPVAREVVERILSGSPGVLTILLGDGVEAADELVEGVKTAHPEVEVEVHEGGQPHYPLLFGAE
jgi:DNA-binding response OmpR family regulator